MSDSDLVWIQDIPDNPDFTTPDGRTVSISWLYNMVRQGKLDKREIVGRTHLYRSQVLKLLRGDTQQNASTNAPPPT